MTRGLTSLTRVDTVLSAPQKPFCTAVITICGQYPRVVTSTGTCRWDVRKFWCTDRERYHTSFDLASPSHMCSVGLITEVSPLKRVCAAQLYR
jgi:hypothetical protein